MQYQQIRILTIKIRMMKSRILILGMMMAALLLATSMFNNLAAQTAKAKTETAKAKKYYCPHHPEKVSDKPGKCSVCGMDLVEMTDSKTMKMDHDKMMKQGESKKKEVDKMKKDDKEMDMKGMKMD
jgi:hypothetical protein